MTKDEALDLALEALEELQPDDAYPYSLQSKAITAIKQARSAPVQEPVAITEQMAFAFHNAITDGAIGTDDLMEIMRGLEAAFAHITTPPAARRQWVGLTRGEVGDLRDDGVFLGSVFEIADTIESKLCEKNGITSTP